MAIIYDKTILLLFCLFTIVFFPNSLFMVLCLLVAVSISSLCYYFQSSRVTTIFVLLYYGLCILNPLFCMFLPMILYDIALYKLKYIGAVGILISIQYLMLNNLYASILFVLVCIASINMQNKTEKYDKLQNEYKRIRDTSQELNLYLRNKNRMLIEKQDDEIHLAMLKERNRIAREIHDNVGHMLSRSLLQVGALLVVCKDETILNNLLALKDTLNNAMNNIRESVHDLHDESIDLYSNINAIIGNFSDYKVVFDYDLSDQVSKKIKYCFIMIIKEAFSNIAKHSNADCIDIIIREHPVFYQLLINDNGTKIQIEDLDSGIGLENMNARVENLNGTISIDHSNGFKIFISIPKKKNEEKKKEDQ
ncbi:MAG: sensor histidine kinase [Lachnotalea sp.]